MRRRKSRDCIASFFGWAGTLNIVLFAPRNEACRWGLGTKHDTDTVEVGAATLQFCFTTRRIGLETNITNISISISTSTSYPHKPERLCSV